MLPETAVLALWWLAAAPGRPQSALEQEYVARRDAYVRELNGEGAKASTADETLARDERALRDLEPRLHAIVGAPKLDGSPGPGRITLETLLRNELGFGKLDGIGYEWRGGWLVATTPALLEGWASQHGHPLLFTDPVRLFGSDDFYTDALATSARYYRLADVPVTHGARATLARASLAFGTNVDEGPYPPDALLVVVVRADRVFVLAVSPDREMRIPVCESVFEREGFEGYRRCYAEAIRARPSFGLITRAAQGFVDHLERAE